MEHLVIEGGRRLEGKVAIDGAKNAALPACVASLLTDEPLILHHIPDLRDVTTVLATVSSLGKRVIPRGETVEIARERPLVEKPEARYVEQMRASFLVLGPLLARLGRAIVPLPGGCTIGRRPVDFHLQGLQAMGARVEEATDAVSLRAEKIRGAEIELPYPSVGATEHLIMTAALAEGETRIKNPAREPEVMDLIELLRKMGAEIEVETHAIRVAGKDRLRGAEHTIIPDRLEAGTYLLAGAITGGDVAVHRVVPEHLRAFLDVLREAGLSFSAGDDWVRLSGASRPGPVRVVTAPYPGFPTDLQPPLVAALSLGRGESRIDEKVFDRRFDYVPSLNRMGARIEIRGDTLEIRGVAALTGTTVAAPDIRAGAALVLAGLAARGRTTVYQMEKIERGYSAMDEKLRVLGGQVERSA
ncbi:MAG: UDP-N-acetylglucosamine 1-carboxyvinyltransferase [Candidatus Bipolaricaulota bacterium]|jgi:UDP-N-acetylglucosamine 1-carboxyvinyltransferase|nr:UDP-N-acetylglucosamine 1-carboxyvinyltransferase [Candidatus Bipolaricaulota bacterium]